MKPLDLLRTFADFAKLGRDVVNQFAEAHPRLILPSDPEAPEPAPEDLIDPEVRQRIEAGEL